MMLKPKKIPEIVVLIEGENEQKYWDAIRFLGKTKKFNLWQATEAKIKSLLRTIKVSSQIVVIADTDQLQEINNFIHNISSLKKHCKLAPIVILQCENFEDELCYSCNCKISHLYSHFGATGIDNLKSNINKEKHLIKKLEKIKHNSSLMWSRSGKNSQKSFDDIKNLIGNHDTLIDKGIRVDFNS